MSYQVMVVLGTIGRDPEKKSSRDRSRVAIQKKNPIAARHRS
jgi:hypothetical protein